MLNFKPTYSILARSVTQLRNGCKNKWSQSRPEEVRPQAGHGSHEALRGVGNPRLAACTPMRPRPDIHKTRLCVAGPAATKRVGAWMHGPVVSHWHGKCRSITAKLDLLTKCETPSKSGTHSGEDGRSRPRVLQRFASQAGLVASWPALMVRNTKPKATSRVGGNSIKYPTFGSKGETRIEEGTKTPSNRSNMSRHCLPRGPDTSRGNSMAIRN